MKIPIVCGDAGCANGGDVINVISGIGPPDLELFYESYNGSDPADNCPACGSPGVAEDALFEHEREKNYYDGATPL